VGSGLFGSPLRLKTWGASEPCTLKNLALSLPVPTSTDFPACLASGGSFHETPFLFFSRCELHEV